MSDKGNDQSPDVLLPPLWIDWVFFGILLLEIAFITVFTLFFYFSHRPVGFAGPFLLGPVIGFGYLPVVIAFIFHQTRLLYFQKKGASPYKATARKVSLFVFVVSVPYQFVASIAG